MVFAANRARPTEETAAKLTMEILRLRPANRVIRIEAHQNAAIKASIAVEASAITRAAPAVPTVPDTSFQPSIIILMSR
ncbi:hypothetical protein D3C80_2108870 [compost metagenome]